VFSSHCGVCVLNLSSSERLIEFWHIVVLVAVNADLTLELADKVQVTRSLLV